MRGLSPFPCQKIASILPTEFLGRFPFNQNFRDFRSEIEWNGKSSGKFFKNLGIRFVLVLVSGNLKIPEFSVPFAISFSFSLLAVLKPHLYLVPRSLDKYFNIFSYSCITAAIVDDISTMTGDREYFFQRAR